MNVDIKWQGSSIKDHTIEYTRQHDICTGVGSLDLIVEGSTAFNFFPWQTIEIYEEGSRVAIYNITSCEKQVPDGRYIIAAQDNSKRLTDYFIDTEYTTEDISYTRYWIELILSDAGVVSYNFNTTSDGQPITIGSQFGMRAAYDAILNLLQLSGWYMYFDSNGVCQIGELDTNKNPVHIYNTVDILRVRTTYSDKNLRNRVYIWGTYDEHDGWITAEAETYLPWFRDDGEDWRSIVYQNSSILYYSTAIKMASRILTEFSRQLPEREIQVVGLHPSIQVGKYVTINSDFGGGNGQITSFIVNVNSEGATTTLLLDKRCPRLFGISDLKAEFVYIGTKGKGVWRKVLDSGYWYAYNTGISTKTIVDLTAYDGLVATVTSSGELYINNNGIGWIPIAVPTGLADQCPISSGILIASGRYVAISTDRSEVSSGEYANIVSVFSSTTMSGFSFGDSTMPLYPPSGNRSWITEYTSDNVPVYTQQIHYGEQYDVGVLDVETDDMGKNYISIATTDTQVYDGRNIGSYGFITQNSLAGYISRGALGRNINNMIPPPTDGIFVKGSDWGRAIVASYISPLEKPVNLEWTADSVKVTTAFGRTSYEPYVITIREMTRNYYTGDEWIDYTIPCSSAQAIGIEQRAYKITKMDDSRFSFIYMPNDDNGRLHFLEVTTGGEILQDTRLPDVQINQFWIDETLYDFTNLQQYANAHIGGNDGDWFIYTILQNSFSDAYGTHSGGAYIRLVNMKTGAYYTYTVYYPDQIAMPHNKNGSSYGYYICELVGLDETPNHVIIAYCGTLVGETTYQDAHPTSIIDTFVIDKYTGTVNKGYYNLEWHNGGETEYWINVHGMMQCDNHSLYSLIDHPEWEHMPPFFSCMRENIENKGGHALLHLTATTDAYRWLYYIGDIITPPQWMYMFYQRNYQCINFRVEIPSANLYAVNSWEDFYRGNSDVIPEIPEYSYHDSIPTWCLAKADWDFDTGGNNNIRATYSSNSVATPVVWSYYRVNPDSYTGYNDLISAFVNPENPSEYIELTQPPGIYTMDGAGNRICNISTVSPLIDIIDGDIHLVIPSGGGTICGYDYSGNLNKMWQADKYSDFYYGYAPLGNGVIYNNYSWKGWLNWPGSGITSSGRMYKVLYHDPVVPSGLFTVIGGYSKPLSLEIGLGLPLVVYDAVSSGWLNNHSTIIAINYTPSGANWQNIHPGMDINNARLLDVFGGTNFPLESGESVPANSFYRFIGVSSDNKVVIFNTDFEENPDTHSVIATISGKVTYVDFTNYFPSPYVFVSAVTSSGQQFFQRHTEGDYFYSHSYGLPSEAITIIRADDRV